MKLKSLLPEPQTQGVHKGIIDALTRLEDLLFVYAHDMFLGMASDLEGAMEIIIDQEELHELLQIRHVTYRICDDPTLGD